MGFSLAQDLWLPSFQQGRGYFGFAGTRLGYSWDVYQAPRLHIRRDGGDISTLPDGAGGAPDSGTLFALPDKCRLV